MLNLATVSWSGQRRSVAPHLSVLCSFALTDSVVSADSMVMMLNCRDEAGVLTWGITLGSRRAVAPCSIHENGALENF